MYDEFGNGFVMGLVTGALGLILIILILSALYGHTYVDTMEDIKAPTLYKVTVDGVETLCTTEPDIKSDYLELRGCTGMPDGIMRVKRYLALEFVEVRGE